MVSAGTLLRAPRIIWQVEMIRRNCMNAARNTEKRREYSRAHSAEEAMQEAEREHIDFKAVSARRSP
jgi:hypothetical protein